MFVNLIDSEMVMEVYKKKYATSVDEYTPCRLFDIYLDANNEIEVNSFRLKGLGRIIWHMLDGKHTISKIIDNLCHELESTERETIKNELLIFLEMLKKRKVIIVNWDPIYKSLLNQELNLDEKG